MRPSVQFLSLFLLSSALNSCSSTAPEAAATIPSLPLPLQPQRAAGISLHLLPERVAILSGQHGGFNAHNRAGEGRFFATPEELQVWLNQQDLSSLQNGLWLMTSHPAAYADEEWQKVERLKGFCTSRKIPFFITRASQAQAWQKQ